MQYNVIKIETFIFTGIRKEVRGNHYDSFGSKASDACLVYSWPRIPIGQEFSNLGINGPPGLFRPYWSAPQMSKKSLYKNGLLSISKRGFYKKLFISLPLTTFNDTHNRNSPGPPVAVCAWYYRHYQSGHTRMVSQEPSFYINQGSNQVYRPDGVCQEADPCCSP